MSLTLNILEEDAASASFYTHSQHLHSDQKKALVSLLALLCGWEAFAIPMDLRHWVRNMVVPMSNDTSRIFIFSLHIHPRLSQLATLIFSKNLKTSTQVHLRNKVINFVGGKCGWFSVNEYF